MPLRSSRKPGTRPSAMPIYVKMKIERVRAATPGTLAGTRGPRKPAAPTGQMHRLREPCSLGAVDLSIDLPAFEPGWVWLVGAGPGDPGLLSLYGLHALRNADVIVYDALVDTRILQMARAGATLEFAGKRGGRPSPRQPDISDRLIRHARAG